MFFRRRESLTDANKGEVRKVVQRLIALSTNDYGYYLFLILSILITTAGLLIGSAPVVIGGMMIAPILTPLLACGLAILLLETKGFIRALTITLLSVIIALVLSGAITIMALLIDPETVIIEYKPVMIHPGMYFIIAFSAGIAGAFAFIKEHLSTSISGVAVSASLVPPLCSIGIGIALHDVFLIKDALCIFLLNVLGIIFAAVVVFWIFGFWDARHFEEKIVEEANNGES